jgi:hypothetical protein
LKALGTNTPFLSRVSALGLKPSGGYSRQNGVSALGAFKTGQVHLVFHSHFDQIRVITPTYLLPIYQYHLLLALGYLAKIWESPKLVITKAPIKPDSILPIRFSR